MHYFLANRIRGYTDEVRLHELEIDGLLEPAKASFVCIAAVYNRRALDIAHHR